jgi:ubiquinone/menaquinone biosynthesis C-methylase UbiE
MNAAAVIGVVLGVLWIAHGLHLRARLRDLPVLSPSGEPVSPDHIFVTRPGVTLDEATRRAASHHARTQGLDALDLVPTGMDGWRAYILALAVDPNLLRTRPLAPGYSAGDALLVDRALLERMKLPALPAPESAVALLELARKVKQYASSTTGIALAPALGTAKMGLLDRRGVLRAVFGDFALVTLLAQVVLGGIVGALAPRFGLLALGAFDLQVVVAIAGTALAPRGLLLYALFRPLVDLACAVGGTGARAKGRDPNGARAAYAELLEQGTSPFFEPRREDCPLCASAALLPFLTVGDHYQFKPGRFALERCADCGHVFQNPRLSLAGLDFYYRDFYDGLGEDGVGDLFSADEKYYVARAKMVGALHTPRRWLDVGAGHGHFCCVARDVFREARFDGLDLAESIDVAARKGWVDRAHRGLFPEVAQALAAAGDHYDVVSMSHYLEHTRDPAAEIAAAACVLTPGGVLMVEVPDPESRLGHLFGTGWMPWFQPQHQHFLRSGALDRLLRANDLEPLEWHRGEAHGGRDLMFFTLTLIGRLARPLDLPWRPRTGALLRVWNRLVWTALFPFLVLAYLLDGLAAPLFRRPGWSNAYRVVARRSA